LLDALGFAFGDALGALGFAIGSALDALGFAFGEGASLKWGIRERDGSPSSQEWHAWVLEEKG
jgi:hypothetical protein